MTAPAEILSRAADLLEARGWVQGAWLVPSRGRCTLGAISASAEEDQAGFDSACVLAEENCGGNISLWNDAPERTLPQVLAMLRGKDWRNA